MAKTASIRFTASKAIGDISRRVPLGRFCPCGCPRLQAWKIEGRACPKQTVRRIFAAKRVHERDIANDRFMGSRSAASTCASIPDASLGMQRLQCLGDGAELTGPKETKGIERLSSTPSRA